MLTICGLVLCARLRESLALLARVPRDLAIAGAAWLLICLASVAWSVDQAFSVGEVKPEIVYPLLAFVVFFVAAARDPSLWPKWWIGAMAGGATAFAGQLLQVWLPVPLMRHDVDGGDGPFSTHLVLLLPLLFALDWPPPWGRDHRPRALVAALCILLMAAWHTGNRIIWLAFAAQLSVGILTWKRLPATPRQHSAALRSLAMVLGVAFAVAFAASVAERFERNLLHDTGVPPGLEQDLRVKIWAVAGERFLEAPWLGHGFGREVLASSFEPLTPRGVNHPILRHGHNMFIDVALETGVAGLAAFVALLAALARRYRGMLREPALAPLGMLGLALLAGFVVKNLTDDFLHRHNALVFWSLNAMLLGLACSRHAQGEATAGS